MDAYGYLISLIEDEKLRVLKRKKKDWILGNIACARRMQKITDAQAVELVAKLEGRKEGDNDERRHEAHAGKRNGNEYRSH